MSDDNGRISVSKDFLRAELGEMELRLVEKLANQDEVAVMRGDLEALKRWRAYLAGASAVAIGLGTVALGVVLPQIFT